MITVAICTFNRATSLKRMLASLTAADKPHGDWEVVIVDNNSTDNTQDVAKHFSSRLLIRCVHEPKQGLSHARNRAIAEARGDVVLFTDDDVSLDRAWLQAYHDAFARFPGAAFFGGRVLPNWDGRKPPRWLKDECLSLLDGVLVWYDQGIETRPYGPDEPPPFGASFAVRRSLTASLGEFGVHLGAKGGVRSRGEETEYLLRAKRAGERGIYVGRALCWHQVDGKRLTLGALFQYGIESGRAHKLISHTEAPGALHRVPMHIARGLGQLLKGRGDRFRQCVINAGIEVGLRRATH